MAALFERRFQQTRQRPQVMGAEDHVEVLQLVDQLLAIALADASAHSDDALRQRRAGAQGTFLSEATWPYSRVSAASRTQQVMNATMSASSMASHLQRSHALEHAGDAL